MATWIVVGALSMVCALLLLFMKKMEWEKGWQFPALFALAALFISATKLGIIKSEAFAVVGLAVLAMGAIAVAVVLVLHRSTRPATIGIVSLACGLIFFGAFVPASANAANEVMVQYSNGQREIATEVVLASNSNDAPLVGAQLFNTTTLRKSLDCKKPVHYLKDVVDCANAASKKQRDAYIAKVNSYADQLGGDWNYIKKVAATGVDTRAIVVINDPKLKPAQARAAVKKVTGPTKHPLPVYHIDGKDILTTRGGVNSDSLELVKLRHTKAVRVVITVPAPGQTVNVEKAKRAIGFFAECLNINPGVVEEKPQKPTVTKTTERPKPVVTKTPTPSRPTSPPTSVTSTPPPKTSTPPTTTTSTPPTETTSTPPTTTTSTPPTTTTSTPPTSPPTTTTPPTSPPTSETPPTSPPTTTTPPTSPPTSETPPTKNPNTEPVPTDKPSNNPSPPRTIDPTDPEETDPAPPTKATTSPTREIPPTSENPTQAPDPTKAPTTVDNPDGAKTTTSETPVVLSSMSSSTPPLWMVLALGLIMLGAGAVVYGKPLIELAVASSKRRALLQKGKHQ